MAELKEIVVISGKGGTGKTSITAAFATLAHRPVIADCDVDAADLHLVLSPRIREKHEFRGGHSAVIEPGRCSGCGTCADLCRFDAIRRDEEGRPGGVRFAVDPAACEGCGVCVRFCPENAVAFPEKVCGEWMVSDTRSGPMVHAKLHPAADNSGKLVSTVRREAGRVAEAESRSLILADGPPGIGCPVIASVTGASLVLAVTEPTVSGAHDLERVLSLARHFGVPAAVCVNKWDIHEDMTRRIEESARAAGARVAGRVRYDPAVTGAQMRSLSAVETGSGAGEDMAALWKNILKLAGLPAGRGFRER